jgi:hypothetical protein
MMAMNNDLPAKTDDPFNSPHSAAMRRHRQRQDLARSREQRLFSAAELNASAMSLLQANPEGLLAFVKRNHHKRSLRQVRQLEQRMREQHA